MARLNRVHSGTDPSVHTAAKFYVDKFNLPAQDALQYLLAI